MQAKAKEASIVRVLLLGAGDSGKSTVVKVSVFMLRIVYDRLIWRLG